MVPSVGKGPGESAHRSCEGDKIERKGKNFNFLCTSFLKGATILHQSTRRFVYQSPTKLDGVHTRCPLRAEGKARNKLNQTAAAGGF